MIGQDDLELYNDGDNGFISPLDVGDGCLRRNPLMQFTGLTDTNGVEIYEGDILECWGDLSYECDSSKHVVEFKCKQGYAAFDLKPTVEVECNALSYFIESGAVEVIGNIYENPELMEAKSE